MRVRLCCVLFEQVFSLMTVPIYYCLFCYLISYKFLVSIYGIKYLNLLLLPCNNVQV